MENKNSQLNDRQAMDLQIKEDRKKVAKNLLWLGIVGIVMLFGGFTSAYVVRHEKGDWLSFAIPQLFYFSTAIMLLSSVTFNWALQAIKKGNQTGLKQGVLVTLLLGLGFVACQYLGWKELLGQKIYFTGPGSNASGQFFYIITLMHLLHLFGGIISLLVVVVKAGRNKYSASDYLGVQLSAIYWHFLDLLWIYLFLFLYFIR